MSEGAGKKGLRILGCLVKGPLGCLAFFVGAIPVFILFFPPACGNMTSKFLEESFAEAHLGSLEVREAWLGSLYGPQEVQSIVLRDPQGEEVFHARLTAPSFAEFFEGRHGTWGPIEIRIPRLVLHEDAEGVSNFTRAIARRPGSSKNERLRFMEGEDISFSYGEMQLDPGARAVDFRVVVDLLSWSDAGGNELLVTNLACDGELAALPEGLRWEMTGRGEIERGSGTLSFHWLVRDLEELGIPGRYVPWTVELGLTEAPAGFANALARRFGALSDVLGGGVDRMDLILDGNSPTEWRIENLELNSGSAELVASGRWVRDTDELVAGRLDLVKVSFSTDSELARRAAGLLPLVEDARLLSPDDRASLELASFSIPVNGGLEEMTADCTLNASVAYALHPSVAAELGVQRDGEMDGPFSFSLGEKEVHFESLRIPTNEGALDLFGIIDLEQDTYAMTLTLGRRRYAVEGARADPELSPIDP